MKKSDGESIAIVTLVAIAVYYLTKDDAKKPATATTPVNKTPTTATPNVVKSGGYTMTIPTGMTAAQKAAYQAAFDAYVAKYNQNVQDAKDNGISVTMDNPNTAAGQEQTLIDYETKNVVSSDLSQQPYIPGFDYMAVFGMNYPGITDEDVAVAQATGQDPMDVMKARYQAGLDANIAANSGDYVSPTGSFTGGAKAQYQAWLDSNVAANSGYAPYTTVDEDGNVWLITPHDGGFTQTLVTATTGAGSNATVGATGGFGGGAVDQYAAWLEGQYQAGSGGSSGGSTGGSYNQDVSGNN